MYALENKRREGGLDIVLYVNNLCSFWTTGDLFAEN